MSNLVPDPENSRNLAPAGKSEVLSDFLVKLNESLLNTTGTSEQQDILETMDRTIEVRKKVNSLEIEEILLKVERDKRIEIALLSSELEIAEARSRIRDELELKSTEVEKKKQSAKLEIVEAKYKIISFQAKQILGFTSIPLFIGFGIYSYLHSNDSYLGITMIVLGLGGALLNSLQDVMKLLGLPTSKDN
jgi:hypothetical protein